MKSKSNNLDYRVAAWTSYQSIVDTEMDRVNFLRKPLGTMNPPELFTPTKVKVLRNFFANGRTCQVGEIVTVPRTVAEGVISAHKAEPV